MSLRVGIVGGGAAGLAAAYELVNQGCHAEVYELSPFLGGQASTFDVGGARLERGYHHLFTNDTDIVELIREIGLEHQMRWIDSTVGTLYEGKTYNFATPLDLLMFSPLPLVDRLRLGVMTLYLQLRKGWSTFENVTADDWLRKHAGNRAYEVFWGPMLRGKFGDDYYKHVGMTWVWGKIHTRVASRGRGMAKEKLGYPIGSFGEIFDVLAQRIREKGGEIHLSASVRKIIIEDGRASGMEVALSGAEPEVKRFDAVISTTPSYIFPRLVPPMPQEYTRKLTDLNYLAAVLIVLILDRPLSSVYWLNVTDRSMPFVGVVEHTNLIGPEHYGGKHIVYLANYLRTDHSFYKMTHEELLQEYLPHIRKINPCFDLSWIETSYHHRVEAAQPIIPINYSSRIPDYRTPFERVYLANTTQVYPEDRGTNYSVRMGRHVARLAMEDLV